MNCKQISSSLSSYLDNELSKNEEILIKEHIGTCEVCRLELAELRKTRLSVITAMKTMADSVEPSAQSWAGLHQRIKNEKGSRTSINQNRLSSLAPGWMVTIIQKIGASQMSRRVSVVVSGALVLGILGFFMVNQTVTPVSAKQILDKAYEAHQLTAQADGISHLKVERYFNPDMQEGKGAGFRMVIEHYTDYKTGNYRMVEYSLPELKVTNVAGYDGKNTYSSEHLDRADKTQFLTVYRSPQSRDKVAGLDNLGPTFSPEAEFDSIRSNPKIRLESEQVMSDGRKAYVLEAIHPADSFNINGKVVEGDAHLERMVFDAQTYELLETVTSIKKNGKEIILSSLHFLVRETMPSGSGVNWDMSDLKGVSFVDDLDRSKGDLLPEKITLEELAAKTSTGYLLKEIPEGFELEITAPPRQKNETSYIYIADYTNKDDYFVIQNSGDTLEGMQEDSDETYTAKNGLVATFLKGPENLPDEKTYQSAVISGPNKIGFLVNSSLPRERVKELIEDLIVVK